MSPQRATRVAWSFWLLVLAVQTAGLVFYGLAGTASDANSVSADIVAFFVFQLFATVGAVVASRRPENPIGWLFLASVGLAIAVIVPFNVADALSTSFDGPPDVVFLLALGLIPAATGLAILRNRLYDIDRIVNRAVVYGAVSALLVAVYFGLVLALQQVFSSFGGSSDLAISTLAVAALFRPVRTRVQRAVDRRFYRRRYDAQRTLEAFSARLRDEIDIAALHGELAGIVRRTMQPQHVSVWLRPAVTETVTLAGRAGGTTGEEQ